MTRTFLTVWVLALGVGLGACRPDDQRTGDVAPEVWSEARAGWPAEVVARVDSGNAAIRADSFTVARRHFARVVELEDSVSAGWFGLYLAELGLGNTAAAADALERARALAGEANLLAPEERR